MFVPPIQTFNKRKILEASLKIVEEKGYEGLNARSIASALHTSTQPIFTYFENMGSLKDELNNFIFKMFAQSVSPSNGLFEFEMSLLVFSHEHPTLFQTLFLSNQSGSISTKEILDQDGKVLVSKISKEFNLNKEKANVVYLNNWIYCFGLASLISLGSFPFKEASLKLLIKTNLDSSILAVNKAG